MTKNFTRPDFSNYVVHFTKDISPFVKTDYLDPAKNRIATMTAKQRLFAILKSQNLFATKMPWTNREATCFTECTWASLLDHASTYSKFGVGFHKKYLFTHGGAPAIYLPPGLMEHQKKHAGDGNHPFDEVLYSFITPFCPPYANNTYMEKYWKGKKPIDYSHEREWRVPHDLNFNLRDVAFVIVATYKDMASAPTDLKDAVGRDNWLIMENYEKIEEFWPVHILPSKR